MLFKNGRYANVASTLALVVALSGTGAYAANTLIPKNSVTANQIANSSIKSIDVKDGSLKPSTSRGFPEAQRVLRDMPDMPDLPDLPDLRDRDRDRSTMSW